MAVEQWVETRRLSLPLPAQGEAHLVADAAQWEAATALSEPARQAASEPVLVAGQRLEAGRY